MKFGIFDHVDATGDPLQTFYENRLKLSEVYDACGYHCYHVAEHHFTPLGLAASPSVYLSAVAQRTDRIKLGPCIYLMALYHPLRLVEEICMLDNMSGGRFQLGVGRGISPFEMGYYGIDHESSADIYHEAYQVVMQGLASNELTFHGKHFQYDRVPMTLRPVQRPHPPLWYGMGTEDAAAFCARNGMNTLSIGLADKVRPLTDSYKAEWEAQGRAMESLPLLGVSRHIVVAETDAEAQAIARRAYPRWHANLGYLWRRHNVPVARLEELYPPQWDAAAATGAVIAGAPDTVRRYVEEQADMAGVNYFCGWFAFGDMTFMESARSARLFADHVMPFAADTAATARSA